MYINDIIDVFSEVKEYDYKGNHYSVRDNGIIRKLAAYIVLGINTAGKKKFYL